METKKRKSSRCGAHLHALWLTATRHAVIHRATLHCPGHSIWAGVHYWGHPNANVRESAAEGEVGIRTVLRRQTRTLQTPSSIWTLVVPPPGIASPVLPCCHGFCLSLFFSSFPMLLFFLLFSYTLLLVVGEQKYQPRQTRAETPHSPPRADARRDHSIPVGLFLLTHLCSTFCTAKGGKKHAQTHTPFQ